MSKNFEVDKIDNVDIYSFGTFDSLKQFISRNRLLEYESQPKTPPTTPEDDTTSTRTKKYNTRAQIRRHRTTQPPNGRLNRQFSSSSSSLSATAAGKKSPSSENNEDDLMDGFVVQTGDPAIEANDYLVKLDDEFQLDGGDASSSHSSDSENTINVTEDDGATYMLWQPKVSTKSPAGGGKTSECGKLHCRLGCICGNGITANVNSNTPANGKHCGRYECMFECTCVRRLRSTSRLLNNTNSTNSNAKAANENKQPANGKGTKTSPRIESNRSILSTTPSSSSTASSFRDNYYYYNKLSSNSYNASKLANISNANSKVTKNLLKPQATNNNPNANQSSKTNQNNDRKNKKNSKNIIKKKKNMIMNTNPVKIKKSKSYFKPYSQNVILQQLSSSSSASDECNQIPLLIEVFTSKWAKDVQLSHRVLKLIGKLVKQLNSLSVKKNSAHDGDEDESWKEIEFDYEKELTIKLVAAKPIPVSERCPSLSDDSLSTSSGCSSSPPPPSAQPTVEKYKPISARIMKYKNVKLTVNKRKMTKLKWKYLKTINDLLRRNPNNKKNKNDAFAASASSTAQPANGDFTIKQCSNIPLVYSADNQQRVKDEKQHLTTCNLVEYSVKKEPVESNPPQPVVQPPTPSPQQQLARQKSQKDDKSPNTTRSLPRILCRSKNSAKISNPKGEIFKQLKEKLEKNKQKLERIVISDQLCRLREANRELFQDEMDFLRKWPHARTTIDYNPFKNENLILDVFKNFEQNDQALELVDTVADVINDMVSVVCKHTLGQPKRPALSIRLTSKENYDENEFLPSAISRDERPVTAMASRVAKPNIIILKNGDLDHLQGVRKYVKVINSNSLLPLNNQTTIQPMSTPLSSATTSVPLMPPKLQIIPTSLKNRAVSSFVPIRPKPTSAGVGDVQFNSPKLTPIYKVSFNSQQPDANLNMNVPPSVKSPSTSSSVTNFPILTSNLKSCVNEKAYTNITTVASAATASTAESELDGGDRKRRRKQDLSKLTNRQLPDDYYFLAHYVPSVSRFNYNHNNNIQNEPTPVECTTPVLNSVGSSSNDANTFTDMSSNSSTVSSSSPPLIVSNSLFKHKTIGSFNHKMTNRPVKMTISDDAKSKMDTNDDSQTMITASKHKPPISFKNENSLFQTNKCAGKSPKTGASPPTVKLTSIASSSTTGKTLSTHSRKANKPSKVLNLKAITNHLSDSSNQIRSRKASLNKVLARGAFSNARSQTYDDSDANNNKIIINDDDDDEDDDDDDDEDEDDDDCVDGGLISIHGDDDDDDDDDEECGDENELTHTNMKRGRLGRKKVSHPYSDSDSSSSSSMSDMDEMTGSRAHKISMESGCSSSCSSSSFGRNSNSNEMMMINVNTKSSSCSSGGGGGSGDGDGSNNQSKSFSPNIHSIRERQRRFKLKNLLIKLQLTFYNMDNDANLDDIDLVSTTNYLNAYNKLLKVKSSKQSVLAEAVKQIKSLERDSNQLERQLNEEMKLNMILKQKLHQSVIDRL